MFSILLHGLACVAGPLFVVGVIQRTKAVFAGRRGPSLLQFAWDLGKLLRRDVVLSRTTTWVFLAGPVVGLITSVLALSLLPVGMHPAALSFEGDFVLFACALGLGRFFTVGAALDTGSPFEGMGGAREVTLGALAEPALFIGFMVLARVTDAGSLTGMLSGGAGVAWASAGASLTAILLGWCLVLLAENARIPFDDPTTHLELTMIHEAMILDHSGPLLGLILLSSAVRLFAFCLLLVGLVMPFGSWGLDPSFSILVAGAGVFGVAVLIGVVESVMARLRLVQVPKIMVASVLMVVFGAVLLAGDA
ncbi:MAG: NADH-quinone oxidoreductase subunit H [Deltaproteobacteria bacterium]|nr:NADH-quinone oxidoreductase subunit H [Deltaproteobacteria bacterium]